MMLMPMPGDIDTSTHPHLVMSRHMIEEKLQPAQPGRPAHDAAMQTNVEQLHNEFIVPNPTPTGTKNEIAFLKKKFHLTH